MSTCKASSVCQVLCSVLGIQSQGLCVSAYELVWMPLWKADSLPYSQHLSLFRVLHSAPQSWALSRCTHHCDSISLTRYWYRNSHINEFWTMRQKRKSAEGRGIWGKLEKYKKHCLLFCQAPSGLGVMPGTVASILCPLGSKTALWDCREERLQKEESRSLMTYVNPGPTTSEFPSVQKVRQPNILLLKHHQIKDQVHCHL